MTLEFAFAALLVLSVAVSAALARMRRPRPVPGGVIGFSGLIVDRPGLFGNTLVTGSPGSGKTSGCLKPALAEILAGSNSPALGIVGGLILDPKAEMADMVADLSSSIPVIYPGIDLRVIAPGAPRGSKERINLISAFTPAPRIAAHLASLCASRAQSRPLDEMCAAQTLSSLLEAGIKGLRAMNPSQPLTLADIYEFVEQPAAGFERMARALPRATTDALHYYDAIWPAFSVTRRAAIAKPFLDRFGPIVKDPRLRAQFCGDSTLDLAHCMTSNQVVLFYPGPEFEQQGDMIASLLKHRFQSEVIAWSFESGEARSEGEHTLLVVADEVSRYLGDVEQEASWLAFSRSLKVVNLWTIQSDDTLASVVGAENEVVLLQSFANRIWFSNTSARTNQRAERICRRAAQAAGSGASRVAEARLDIDAADFASLKPLECISFGECQGRPSVRRHLGAAAVAG